MPRIEKSALDELVEELFKTSSKSKEEKRTRKAKSYARFSKNK